MNFLDPEEWCDLGALEKEHEELNEELVRQLHIRLKPYFLRRIKSEVLQLPPKVGFPHRRFGYILIFSRTRSSFLFLWLLCKKKSIGLSSVRVLRGFCHCIFSRLSHRRSKLGHSSKPHPTYDCDNGEAPDQ